MSTPPSLIYATLPYGTLFDSNKLPISYGEVYFYDNVTRQLKNVYADVARTIPYPNPLTLDNAGRVPPLYFQQDSPYYIEAWSAFPSVMIWSVSTFVPGGASGDTPITLTNDIDNIFINGQFRFYTNSLFSPIIKNTAFLVAPDAYYFIEDGINTSDSITFNRFLLDDQNVDATPIYSFNYSSPTPGSSETIKDLYYQMQDVRALSGEQVSFSLCGLSVDSVSQQVEIIVDQYFGTGGTPSTLVSTNITSFTLTGSWGNPFVVTFIVPDLTGKTIGTNGDDCTRYKIRLPRQTACNIEITNIYLKRGQPNIYYPFQSYAETSAQLQALNFPLATNLNNYDTLTYVTPQFNAPGVYEFMSPVPIGGVIECFSNTAPPGWVFTNGALYPTTGTFQRLYAGFPLSIGYNETNLSGWSIYASTEEHTIVLVSDVIGTLTFSPTTSNPALATIAAFSPGSPTTRGSFEIVFADPMTATDFYIECSSAPGTLAQVLYFNLSPTQDNFFPTNGILYRIKQGPSLAFPAFRDNTILQLNAQRFGSDDNFSSIVTTDIITVTASKMGAEISAPSAGTSPFTLVLTTPGAPVGTGGAYEVITITAVAAALIDPSTYFLISTPYNTICFYAIVDNVGIQPTGLTVNYYVPLLFTTTMTSIEVATVINTAINYVFYAVPDTRGLFTRDVSATSIFSDPTLDGNIHVDPNYLVRAANPGVNSAQSVGSIELDSIASHDHPLNAGTIMGQNGSDFTTYNFVPGSTRPTLATGDTETRPINKYVRKIIKY